jgi:hypothetical protein
MPTTPVLVPAPSTLAAALAELGITVQLAVSRADGQPLTENDLAAVEAHAACADVEAGRAVSDDDAARAAVRALERAPAASSAATSTAAE